jgi:hypothetical protein
LSLVLKNIFAKKRQMEDQGGSADKKVAVSRCSPNKSGAKQRVTHFYLTKCLYDDDRDTLSSLASFQMDTTVLVGSLENAISKETPATKPTRTS